MSEETTNRYFDELASGLASGSISRRRALRLMGAALVGGTLGSFGIGEAAADDLCKPEGKKCRKDAQCCSGNCSTNGTCAACPAGTTLCGGQCVSSCSEGVLDPNTCQCVCPAVSCCCTCVYQDNTTGNFITVCNASNSTITEAQCQQSCQSATPPPGTSFLNFGHACEPGSSGLLRVCRPIVGSPNASGFQCDAPFCIPPPT
jgi:hypothetical protein